MEWKKAVKKEGNTFEIPKRWLLLHYYEAFNILFRIENALRMFVYIVLKNEKQSKWLESAVPVDEGDQSTIIAIAKKRIEQARTFGYLSYNVTCPIMYLNSGELIRLITSEAYWSSFKPYFMGAKEIIRNKLDEIGSIRNSLAHFRPIKEDDIEVINQNAKHVLMAIEQGMSEMFRCTNVVPTNTPDDWYKQLRTLGTELCTLLFYQSNNQDWIKITLIYNCLILTQMTVNEKYRSYNVLNVMPAPILLKHSDLSNLVIYLSEFVPFASMDKDLTPDFTKHLSFVLSRKSVSENFEVIKKTFQDVLSEISEETDLIRQDNLARGEIIEAISASAKLQKVGGGETWWANVSDLYYNVKEGDPPEYWGFFDFVARDFIAGTHRYPWMPANVSEFEFSF